MTSRWNRFDVEIARQFSLENPKGSVEIAKYLLNTTDSKRQNSEVLSLSKYIDRNKKHFTDDNEGIYNATASLDLSNKHVKHLWVKDKGVSAFVKNPDYVEPENDPVAEIDFLSIFKDKIEPVIVPKNNFVSTAQFDRLVIADVHVGMDVNKDGFALYDGIWDETELFKRLELTISHVLKHKKSNTIYIDELGDFLDGWDSKTVRREHELPQNMDNQKAFDTALKFKITLIDSLVPHYDKIISHNVTDDNHSGAFSYVVNSAYKTYMDLKYPENVEVIVQRKFIDYYQVGKQTFILCHGKDGKNLRFGFKPILDKVQENKIDNYIKENYLLQKDFKIEFSKADSHQYIFDNSTSTTFRYCNYPAFSPPSNWVKTNFMNSMSGFVFFNYYEDGQKTTHDYFF